MISSTYFEGNSLFHRADPRLKLCVLLVWVVFFVLPSSLKVLVAYFLVLSMMVTVILSLRVIFIALRTIWPILLLVLILTPPFHQSGDTLLELTRWYRVTTGGLAETTTLMLRFSGITLLFLTFFRTTSIDQFILTLRWYGLPYSATLVVTIAFRYIPSLIQVYHNIQDAHALRRPGSSPEHTVNPLKKFSRLFPTLVSVMIHAVKGIPSLSMALEVRGFGRGNPRSSYRALPTIPGIVHQLPFFTIVLLIIILLYIF